MGSESGTALKQQLYETVLVLASDEGAIEERLAHAYFEHMLRIDPSALPVDARKEYEMICGELHKMYPEKGKIDGVEQGAAVNLAMRIILIYDSLIK